MYKLSKNYLLIFFFCFFFCSSYKIALNELGSLKKNVVEMPNIGTFYRYVHMTLTSGSFGVCFDLIFFFFLFFRFMAKQLDNEYLFS